MVLFSVLIDPCLCSVPPVITPFKWAPVDEGHFVHNPCVVADGDLPQITWLKNGRPITSDPKDVYIMQNAMGVSAMSIAKVTNEKTAAKQYNLPQLLTFLHPFFCAISR